MRNITLGATYSVLCAVEHKTDAATGEHGDLLDLIARNRDLPGLREAMDEACQFLALPHTREPNDQAPPAPSNSPRSARRLFRAGRPIPGTPAEAYLRARGITARLDWVALRFHPRVWYRETDKAPLEAWPALLAAVTDPGGRITGIQRTWLDRNRPDKAPIADPRRALGRRRGKPGFAARSKMLRTRHPPRCYGPGVRPRSGTGLVIAVKAATSAADPPAERHPR